MAVHSIVLFQEGDTPLHLVSKHNRPGIVSVLLQGGADINIRNPVSITKPFWISTLYVQCYRFLKKVTYTAIKIRTTMAIHSIVSFQNGWTPLHKASFNTHPDAVSALLQGGADVNIRSNVSITQWWILYIMYILDLYIVHLYIASQTGDDADSSRAPGLTSGLQRSVNVHRGALLLVPQWQCISSFVFYIVGTMSDTSISIS